MKQIIYWRKSQFNETVSIFIILFVKLLSLVKNIPVVLPRYPIKIWSQGVHDWTYVQTDIKTDIATFYREIHKTMEKEDDC